MAQKVKRAAGRKTTPRSTDNTDVFVGARIRARRLEIGLSQEVLGEKIGVSFQQVQKYEKGANRVGAGRLRQLGEALDVEPSYFFEGLKKSKGEVQVSAMDVFASDSLAMRVVKSFPLLPTENKRTVVRMIEQMVAAGSGS